MEKEEKKKTRTQVYNVIIMDKSGSMESIRDAAISGFNETLAGIKKAQEKFSDTQDHFVSLLTFCDCERKYVFDKVPVSDAHPLTRDDYEPCCCTPLYDAMGFTLTTTHNYVKNIEDCVIVVTIITDGMENASKEYTGQNVKQLVERLKGEGWTFTYMGANQDSFYVASNLALRNARNFDYSEEGTIDSMKKDAKTRMNFFSRLADFKINEFNMYLDDEPPMDATERRNRYTAMADEAFDEEEQKN